VSTPCSGFVIRDSAHSPYLCPSHCQCPIGHACQLADPQYRPCRLTGAAAFTGLGGYAIYEASRQGTFRRVRPPGSPVIGGQVTAVIGLGELIESSGFDCSPALCVVPLGTWSWGVSLRPMSRRRELGLGRDVGLGQRRGMGAEEYTLTTPVFISLGIGRLVL
jgi:hypothetical protein